MFKSNNLWHLGFFSPALLAGIVINMPVTPAAIPVKKIVQNQSLIATLADGNYQLCSQPDPQNWQDGAGICANFAKIGNRIDGYYGYPHSSEFICIKGEIKGNQIGGEALAVSWASHEVINIPESAFTWDTERRLTLDQASILHSVDKVDGRTDWIKFNSALLNLEGFYQYPTPRMTPPAQICNWNPK